MKADWIECEMALCISANRDAVCWGRHSEALATCHEDESRAFSFILVNFDHSNFSKELLNSCRNSNGHKFWSLAEKHWSPSGPQVDRCHGIERMDAVYYW